MLRLSVDVGGTFTDLVAMDEITGSLRSIKVPSIPKRPEEGVLHALEELFDEVSPHEVKMIGHATTIATNALFGQTDLEIPPVGMITTKGFRDVIEIGRQRRAEVYNLFFEKPPMLSERMHRYVVEERMSSEGDMITTINRDEVEEALNAIKTEEIPTVAICFLNSYANPLHEEVVADIAENLGIDAYLVQSNESSSEYREFERFSTAVVDAALMPIMNSYINRLKRDLKSHDLLAPLYIMQSNGGLALAENAARHPSRIVESGPASGVIAAAWLGKHVGEKDIISFDMGGTTAKAGIVRGLIPEVVPEYEVAGNVHMGRLVKGSGYPVRFPFIDLAECSAGGGTIAWQEEGILHVGPQSSGAYPGPACYDRGGKDATITDANLILGRLNQEELLDGTMKIDADLSRIAMESLSEELGMSVEETAISIIRIANSIMSKILRIVSVERGFDPRIFSIVAFGGAGPMHVCALAEELEISKVIIPGNPGMFSALGLLTADLFHDYTKAIVEEVENIDADEINELLREMERRGREALQGEGVGEDDMSFLRMLDMRYLGQAYEITVNTRSPFNRRSFDEAVKQFHRKHAQIYGYSSPEEPIELVNIRLRSVGHIQKPELKLIEQCRASSIPEGYREVYYENIEGWRETPVFDRRGLKSGFQGPAIIEQYDATTVVYDGWNVSSNRYGNLILRRESA
ncbi:MAG: hydantoinase/oxoprolinase family protein [Candidatus Bathyarchaeia archaeon]